MKTKQQDKYRIVGIGASAGGLNAFTQLLRQIPSDTGIAFVLVQHLDPKQASFLPGILAKVATIPVAEVTATTNIEANHIYTMPSDRDMIITNGRLQLIKRKDDYGIVHKPIDTFFTSLAKDQLNLAVGVVLSGTGTDGTIGLKAIKSHGGTTFAQDETAEYKDMPESAVAARVVDFVFSPSALAQRIIQINDSIPADEVVVDSILAFLKTKTGIDFKEYKTTSVHRRIRGRMMLGHFKTLEDYRKLLISDESELEALQKDMLIHVTGFFRDPEQFQFLKKTVLPAILKNKVTAGPIKVWVPGCASGEEAYSVAIELIESLGDTTETSFTVLGTDISEDAIKKARQGIYQMNIRQHVSPERLRRFFTKVKNGYKVKKLLSDACQFLVIDISDTPPVASVDLISCQNVLIYLGTTLQQNVLSQLHAALNPDGFLVLGKSESIGTSTKLFQTFDNKYSLYVKDPAGDKTTAGSNMPGSLHQTINSAVVANAHAHSNKTTKDDGATQFGSSEQADRQHKISKLREALSLTQEYADSIIGELGVMNGEMQSTIEELTTIREELESRNDEITLARDYAEAIIKTVREPLIILDGKLRVKSASKSFYTTFKVTPKQTENVLLYDLGNRQWNIPKLKTLLEKTLPKNNTLTDYEVVHVFKDIGRKTMLLNARTLQQGPDKMPLILLAIEDITERKQVEAALVESEDLFRTASEKMTTLSEELQTRNEEVTIARDYADAIIRTVRGSMLVLNKDLRIISANEAFYNAFKVASSDTENRLLYDLGNRQWNIPKLKTLLEKILPEKNTIEDFVVEHDFTDIGQKTMLLNARTLRQGPDKTSLILLAIEDITENKKAEKALRESGALFQAANKKMTTLSDELQTRNEEVTIARDYADAIIRTVRGPLLVLNKDLRIISANEAFYNAFKVAPNDTENRLLYDLGNRQWNIPKLKTLLEKILPKSNTLTDYEVVHDFKEIGQKTMLLNARTLQQGPDKTSLILLAFEDITERKQLERQKDEFISIASHELKTPVTSVKAYTQILGQRFRKAEDIKSAELVEKMDSQLDKLTNLIGDLLDITKIEAGGIQFHESYFDFNELVENTVEELQRTTEKHRIVKELQPSRTVYGDHDRLGQVLTNFMTNAIKYSPQADKIIVKTSVDKDNITLSVQDFGVGLSQKDQAKVFERFYRVGGTNQNTYPGLGLGLYIASEIIKRHKGRVWVVSHKAKGSTFCFSLPMTKQKSKQPKEYGR